MTENSTPLVSICITTYNQENFIQETIESVLQQETDFPIEVLVGEDCSTDATRQIVLEFERQHPGIVRAVLSPINVGANKNLVGLLKETRGKYVALLEGDDLWTSTQKIKKQASFLDQHPECTICFHRAERYIQEEDQITGVWPDRDLPMITTIEDLSKLNYIPTCSVMYRNVDIGGFSRRYYELKVGDWPLHMMYAQKGKIGFVDEIMARYRIHNTNSFSNLSMLGKFERIVPAQEFMFNRLPKENKITLSGVILEFCYQIAQMSLAENNNGKARHYLSKGMFYLPYFKYYAGRHLFLDLYFRTCFPRLTAFITRFRR